MDDSDELPAQHETTCGRRLRPYIVSFILPLFSAPLAFLLSTKPCQYFAYATYLDENTFRRSIGSPNYRESATVVADDAWLCKCVRILHSRVDLGLSHVFEAAQTERILPYAYYESAFDYCGIPFVQPAYAS